MTEEMSGKKKNFYEILNLTRDCKPDEIKKSFIEKSKEYHPDKNIDSKYSHEKFLDIHEAYKTLNNPQKRQQYDQFLLRSQSENFGVNNFSSHSSSNGTNTTKFILRLSVLPKAVMLAALVFISIVSTGIQFHFIRDNFQTKKEILENKSLMAGLILSQAKEEATIYGREEQARRLEQGLLGQFDTTELIDKYIKESCQDRERNQEAQRELGRDRKDRKKWKMLKEEYITGRPMQH